MGHPIRCGGQMPPKWKFRAPLHWLAYAVQPACNGVGREGAPIG